MNNKIIMSERFLVVEVEDGVELGHEVEVVLPAVIFQILRTQFVFFELALQLLRRGDEAGLGRHPRHAGDHPHPPAVIHSGPLLNYQWKHGHVTTI